MARGMPDHDAATAGPARRWAGAAAHRGRRLAAIAVLAWCGLVPASGPAVRAAESARPAAAEAPKPAPSDAKGAAPQAAPASDPGQGRRRPNLVVLLSDDQRFDTIRALGNRDIQTPHLDRLVQRSFVFTRAYTMGAMNSAVCLPSRAMLLSGRTLWHVPVNLEGVRTWPELLREAGYVTVGIGKWHNGSASFARAFTAGGAIFFGGMANHAKVPVFDFDPEGKYPAKKLRVGDAFSSELFADEAVGFLKEWRGAPPFLLYVAFTAPHDPRIPPDDYRQRYDPAALPLPKSFLPAHPFDNGDLKSRDELLAPPPRSPETVRQHTADYYAMLTHLDAQVGRILQALDESGQAERTVVVFASDNGVALGRHGLLGKQNLYDHSLRVPLMIAGPGIKPGRSEALVYLFDLFPTLCDLLGVQTPPQVEGTSLLPVLRGEQSQVRTFLVGAYMGLQRMIRDDRWKLILYNVKGRRTEQLFDLADDPAEMHDRSADPADRPVRDRLAVQLARTLRELDDPADFEVPGPREERPQPAEPPADPAKSPATADRQVSPVGGGRPEPKAPPKP